MKKKSSSKSAFFNPRSLIGLVLCVLGLLLGLLAYTAYPGASLLAQKPSQQTNPSNGTQAPFGPPDVVQMVGPVAQNQDLRSLPYVAPKPEVEDRRLMRYPHDGTGQTNAPSGYGISGLPKVQALLLESLWRPAPTMPGPLLTFEGLRNTCGCQPSDSEGDVGPNHYIEAINESIKIFDKSGNTLSGPTSYNSFFSGLTGTPCANANDGDPYVIYDQAADRWLISDFAFPSFPGSSFWQCIGVSQTPDLVSGGWFLYALQVDPANPTYLGDYPKFALWNSGGSPAQNAYFLMMNLFSSPTTFNGVRAYALDRASMLAGGPTHAIGFTLSAADVGASYSFVAASFRTGDPAPAGRNEMVLAIDSPASGGVPLTQVHARFFHVDFVTPANSVFGLGPTHQPNAEIIVNPFVDAFTNTTSNLVQGEAVMFPGVGFHSGVRWGDYTRTEVDPSNGMDFWHINQYAQSSTWHTRIGKFNFVGSGSPTPTPTASPSATPTATPSGCSWSAGPDMPTVLIRAVGVYFPADGNFYTMGGRTSDTAGSDFQHVLRYSPGTHSWTQMGVTLPDNQMNNIACGVLTLRGTPEISCVGGSAAGQSTATTPVFCYT